MKQILNRLLKILLLILFSIGSVIFIIITFFTEDIEKSVISKIQQNIEAPLILDPQTYKEFCYI